MSKLGSKDGEMVKGGSKFLPAAVPTLALILVGVLPGYLSGLYGAHVEKLMEAYVTFGYLFICTVLAGLSIMIFRDRSALTRTIKVFRFRPIEPVYEREDLVPIKVQSDRIGEE